MKPHKGFTLIELLIAMLILMFVMLGFLAGILNYIRYSLDARMKGAMDKLVKDWSGYLDSVPYSALNSTSPSFGDATCDFFTSTNTTRCSFENADSDGDGIPDFYDPYSGNNNSFRNNPTSTASWLLVSPSNNPFGSSSPATSYAMGGRRVFVGITTANVVMGGREVGKAFGITSWYFSPMNGNYRYESTLLIKRKP